MSDSTCETQQTCCANSAVSWAVIRPVYAVPVARQCDGSARPSAAFNVDINCNCCCTQLRLARCTKAFCTLVHAHLVSHIGMPASGRPHHLSSEVAAAVFSLVHIASKEVPFSSRTRVWLLRDTERFHLLLGSFHLTEVFEVLRRAGRRRRSRWESSTAAEPARTGGTGGARSATA